jgi:hypothetical protein
MAATNPFRVKDLLHKYGWDFMARLSSLGVQYQAEAQVLFVDSGATQALDADDTEHGHSFDKPLATIDYAIGLCTADEGSVILVAPGHNETLAAATIDFDVAGVTCIGLGEGTLRPRIDFDNAASSIDIGANNVTLVNLTLLPSITDILIGIDVEANVTNFKMFNCEVLEGEDGSDADEFIVTVDLKSGNNDSIIKNNIFRTQAAAAGCTSAISLTAASARVRIEENLFVGNWSTAAIIDGAACTNVFIKNNVMKVKDGEPGIELTATTTGIIVDNRIESTGATVDTTIVAADCSWFNNSAVVVDGAAAETIGGGAVAADLAAVQLDHLAGVTTGVAADGDLSPYVVTGSTLSHIMSAGADVTTAFNASTDSLEAISTALAAGTGCTTALDADQLDHLMSTDTTVAADADLTTYIADGTALAHIMSATANTSTYKATTDSLEAISVALAAGTGVTTALEADNLDHLTKAACADTSDPVDMTAEVVDDTIISNVLTNDGDTSTYDRRFHSLQAIAAGTPKIATKSTGDLTASGTSVSLFSVTGDVLIKVGASVDVAVTSTSGTTTVEVGVAGNTACLCVQDAVDNTAFAIGDSWSLDTAADTNGASVNADWVLVGNGVDVIMTVSVDDITAGDIDFYALYIPLSADGAVAAA